MNSHAILVSVSLAAIGLVGIPMSTALPPPPPPNPIPCTNVDTSNPHFYNGHHPGATEHAFTKPYTYSTNGVPTGCDLLGSDGDNEQGIGGGEFPLIGATCAYEQGPITVGHHGLTGYYATNVGDIDIVWVAGTDGYDAVSDINAVGSCVGNGLISDDPATDPNDCFDNGMNINLLASFHKSADLILPNDPSSASTCLDAVDGNAWVALLLAPYVGTNPGNGPLLVIDTDAIGSTCIVDIQPTPGPILPPPPCLVTVNLGWQPPTPDGCVGFSIPISGTIADGNPHNDGC